MIEDTDISESKLLAIRVYKVSEISYPQWDARDSVVRLHDHLAAMSAANAEWKRQLFAKCKEPFDRILNGDAAGICHEDIYGWPVEHDLAEIGGVVTEMFTEVFTERLRNE